MLLQKHCTSARESIQNAQLRKRREQSRAPVGGIRTHDLWILRRVVYRCAANFESKMTKRYLPRTFVVWWNLRRRQNRKRRRGRRRRCRWGRFRRSWEPRAFQTSSCRTKADPLLPEIRREYLVRVLQLVFTIFRI